MSVKIFGRTLISLFAIKCVWCLFKRSLFVVFVTTYISHVSSLTNAQSLEAALANAYLTNPELQAGRAELRAADELVNQAISNWHPEVELNLSAGMDHNESNSATSGSDGLGKPRFGELKVEQNIYRGGRTEFETEQRENEVKAKRAELKEIEQEVLLNSAIAYMSVFRDTAVLKLQINSEKVILRQLGATRDRFSVGEVTRTDVSLSEARLARAKADRIQAEGDLENSRTKFERVIGLAAVNLKSPVINFKLPSTLKAAIVTATKKNPAIISALYWEKAANRKILKIKGELLPELNLEGSLKKSADEFSAGSTQESAQIIANLRIPIYQQGMVTSRIREAKQLAAQRRLMHQNIRRLSIEAVRTAWEDLATARARIEAFNIAINSSEIALEGVRQEANVGSRTVLDVLDAEQELLDAQVNLVRVKGDEFVAATELLVALGELTAKDFKLKVDYYNVNDYYNKVRDTFFN